MTNLQSIIENAWDNRELLQEDTTQKAIREVVELLDNGTLRVAEPVANGWQVNEWVKKSGCNVFSHTKNGNIGSRYF